MAPRRRRPLLPALVLAAATLGAAGCSDDGSSSSPERFCGEVVANKEILTQPDLPAADDPELAIDELIAEYRRIGEFAPLAIEQEWDQLVTAYEVADQVIPGDTQSEQEALEAIYRSEKSAVAVSVWLRTNCGVRLGPLATIVPPAPTTTLDPATTEAP